MSFFIKKINLLKPNAASSITRHHADNNNTNNVYSQSMVEFIQNILIDIVPHSIAELITSYTIANTKKYSYVAVFTSKTQDKYKHLTLFNNNVKTNIDIPRIDMYPDNKTICHDSWGTIFHLQKLKNLDTFICNYLFPQFSNINKEGLNVVLRVDRDTEKLFMSIVETNDFNVKPLPTNDALDRCALAFTKKYGLTTFGGYGNSTVDHLIFDKTAVDQDNPLKWINVSQKHKKQDLSGIDLIPKLQSCRANASLTIFDNEERIFICGGFISAPTNIVEFYDHSIQKHVKLKKRKWITLKNMNYSVEHPGSCYWKEQNKVVVVGGGVDYSARNAEMYDFVTDKWLKLPDTNHYHLWYPDLYVTQNNNNTVEIIGSHYKLIDNDKWGFVERIDLRDSANKWIVVNNKPLSDVLNFKNNVKDRQMRAVFKL